MKYLPLVWAALWRKPAEAILTFLAVTAAFTLFATMWGANLTVRRIIDLARMDLLTVQQRGTYRIPHGLPISMSGQISRIDGVTGVGATRSLVGYHVDPHTHVGITMVDEGMREAWAVKGQLNSAQWTRLKEVPTGIFASVKAAKKWSLKPGDTFTVVTGQEVSRIDGGNAWDFQVLDIIPDDPDSRSDEGIILGNSLYLENSLADSQRDLGYSFQVAVRDANRAVQISKLIDQRFANSGTPVMTTPNRINALHQLDRGLDTASMTAAIASAGLVVILFVTGSAIARSVRERIPEFAALSAVGYRNSQLLTLVFIEAAIPCLLGALLGSVLGNLLERGVPKLFGHGPAHLLSIPAPRQSVLCWGVGFALVLAFGGSLLPMLRMRYQSVNDAMAGR